MKALLRLATVGMVVATATGYSQEPKKQPEKADVAKALFMVSGLH